MIRRRLGYESDPHEFADRWAEADHDLAHRIIELCYQRGLLLFSPVGAWGQTVKIAPPLTIPQDALEDGLAVLSECTDIAVKELS